MNRILLLALTGGGRGAPLPSEENEVPLAQVRYGTNPVSSYSLTSVGPPLTAIDSTHLKITFTAPASGNVRVVLQGWQDVSSGSMLWGLIEGGSDVAGCTGVVNRAFTNGDFTHYETYVSGLTPGSTHTYVWGWSNGNTMRLFVGDGTTQDVGAHIWQPAMMQVWAA